MNLRCGGFVLTEVWLGKSAVIPSQNRGQVPFSRLQQDSHPVGRLLERLAEAPTGANALACFINRSEPQCGHTETSWLLTRISLRSWHFAQTYSKSGITNLRTSNNGTDSSRVEGPKTKPCVAAPSQCNVHMHRCSECVMSIHVRSPMFGEGEAPAEPERRAELRIGW